MNKQISTEVLVVGSGAGGSTVAAELAANGHEVIVIEEGDYPDQRVPPNSVSGIQTLWRNRGITPIQGGQSITFVEGRCVGGSTEINSGFWRRPSEEVIERWRTKHRLSELSYEDIAANISEIESNLNLTTFAQGSQIPRSSSVFVSGARSLGLTATEMPRLQDGEPAKNQFKSTNRSSMSRTLLPKAKALGVKIIPNCEARKINFDNRKAKSLTARVPHEGGSTDIEVAFQTLFICGGPVQSAALLIKSGVKRNIGTSFYVHPMVKMTAKFNEIIDAESAPLPVFQVTTPGGATLGGSVFSTSFAGMALGGMNATGLQELPNHQQMASYYVSSAGTGVGSVKVLPFIGSTMTRYKLSGKDINTLQEGAATLIRLLFEAGAEKVIPDASHIDAAKWISKHSSRSTEIPEVNKLSLSTVHAFSSCRMGEDESIYPVDSSGKLFATDNVYVADASILPDAPGVNPQATIMAMALRIARRFGN